MVDPSNVDYYLNNPTDEELQEFLLFCICVAGKTAKQISIALNRFFELSYDYLSKKENISISKIKHKYSEPFKLIKKLIRFQALEIIIKDSKLGKNSLLFKSFVQLCNSELDLRTVTISQLEEIKGIGPKTSRYFKLYTGKESRHAVLDTHVLRFMREELNINTPKITPTGKKYAELENKFLQYVDSTGKSISEFDLEIWNKYSRK